MTAAEMAFEKCGYGSIYREFFLAGYAAAIRDALAVPWPKSLQPLLDGSLLDGWRERIAALSPEEEAKP